jgi:hypothetical protein
MTTTEKDLIDSMVEGLVQDLRHKFNVDNEEAINILEQSLVRRGEENEKS